MGVVWLDGQSLLGRPAHVVWLCDFACPGHASASACLSSHIACSDLTSPDTQALMDYKLMRERENLKHADQLARQREADKRAQEMEDERMRAAIRRQAEEDIQAERRRTEEHRAKLERENMRARAVAEAEGRIKEQRENEDVFARQLRLRAEEDRVTKLESIAEFFKHANSAASSFITDKGRVTTTVVALSALAAGVYASREGARVVASVIQKRLLTPALVRETSRSSSHFALSRRVKQLLGTGPSEGYSLSDVILRGDVSSRVHELAASITSTQRNKAPYRNLLFYGPPGTGKTMVAKRLARLSGMDYAIMSGGDVGPLGRDAVTELHKLFDWATVSKRGLLVFMDEADAFLASRSKTAMSEEQRNALNAVLYRTGEASDKVMLVLATNRPGDLDAAVTDRVDESVRFGLPDEQGRAALLKQYFTKYIVDSGKEARVGPFGLFTRSSARIPVASDVDDPFLTLLATETEGFSGRGIAKLMLSVQGTAYGRVGPTGGPALVTRALLREVLAWKVEELATKRAFAQGDAEHDYVAEHAATEGAGTGQAEPQMR